MLNASNRSVEHSAPTGAVLYVSTTALTEARSALEPRVHTACKQMLAIQDTCDETCCSDGPVGDAAFANVPAEHNYQSNIGPGPWLVAVLDQFDDAIGANYGAGLWDILPCPRTNNLDPTNPNTCDPATCTSDPMHPGQTYGCWRCDEVARVGYIFAKCSNDASDHLKLEVTSTVQRSETSACEST